MKQIKNEQHLTADILVIGGGMAGLFAAIKARQAGLDVILTDKGYVGRSGGTHYAEGDIQFYRPKRGHKLDQWLNFLNVRNEYMNNPEWNQIIMEESEDRYKDLVDWGIQFFEENGRIDVNGPHALRGGPVIYEFVSMKNRAYAPTLRSKAIEEGVRIYDKVMTCDLLKQDGKVIGAVGVNTTTGMTMVFNAKATVMAAGGGSAYKCWAQNSDYWTGDPDSMAYRVGAEIAGKEFMRSGHPIESAAVRKSAEVYTGGGIQDKIVDVTAKYPYMTIQSGWFWPRVNAENEPTSWIGAWDVHCGKGPLFYDLNLSTGLENYIKKYFRRVGSCEPDKIGLDFFDGGKLLYPSARSPIFSVVGGSGIWPIDKYGTSSVPGLFAAGASCATMASGAYYGGMGIGQTAGMVTGARAAKAAVEYAQGIKDAEAREETISPVRDVVRAPIERNGGFSPAWVTQILQHTMVPYYVMMVKSEERMQAALTMVEFMKNHLVPLLKANNPHELRLAHETRNMVLNAEMQLRASMFRKESRGSHFREDYPTRNDPEWLAWTKLKDVDGKMEAFKEPIPEKFWPDLSRPKEELYPMSLPLDGTLKD